MVRVGFTGTRIGMSEQQRIVFSNTIETLKIVEFHHGDCVGADAEAHDIISSKEGVRIIIHPPDDGKLRAYKRGTMMFNEKPYLERNHDIVDSCDLLIATPKEDDDVIRCGTWATVRYARQCEKNVIVIRPDGRIWKEQSV